MHSIILTTTVLLSLVTVSFVWIGCQSEPTLSQLDVAAMLPGDPQAIAQVMEIQDMHTDELMNIESVVGTGTALGPDGTPVIMVYTSRALTSAGKIASAVDWIV